MSENEISLKNLHKWVKCPKCGRVGVLGLTSFPRRDGGSAFYYVVRHGRREVCSLRMLTEGEIEEIASLLAKYELLEAADELRQRAMKAFNRHNR